MTAIQPDIRPALEIPQDVCDEVVWTLNRAIALAARFEPTFTASMIESAGRFNDAINDALASEA